ncbi:MATE family efflux transporter [Tessaracoccus defluvii]|uniref:Uncharacterized protein n=1 Tax=Tessaracoccus defluvii TaxID=1285901 RepID=A0A7H0H714_9ACTN|nr:MATE family efflux transporter [Tessaracoccus defluvii]QNP56330.1 hypothetical protein H9L22_02335 [Tessaracoccus defluvii]
MLLWVVPVIVQIVLDPLFIFGLGASLGYGVAVTAGILIFAEPLVGAFLADGPSRADAVDAVRIVALGFAVAGVAPLVSGYFQALGRALGSYVISIGSLVAVKVPLVLALSGAGPTGIWVALPVGELVACLGAAALLLAARHRARTPASAPGAAPR